MIPFSALLSKTAEVLGAWLLASAGFGLGFFTYALARGWSEEDSRAAVAENRHTPRAGGRPECTPPPHPQPIRGARYLRGYWTPDGKRLTTMAGSPQVTGWMAFTTAELLEARGLSRARPAKDDKSLAVNEATVAAIAYHLKKERTKHERLALRLAARLN